MQSSLKDLYKDFLSSFTKEDKRIYYNKIREMPIFNQISLEINHADLFQYNEELALSLLQKPEEHIEEIGEAIREIIETIDPEYAKRTYKFYGRIYNIDIDDYKVSIRNIRAKYVGNLIQVKGIVTKASRIRQKIVEARYICLSCKNEFKINFLGAPISKFDQLKCSYCGKKDLRILDRKMMDFQKIIIQETTEEIPAGQIPRTIEVYMEDDLVDKAYPGNRVTVVGILKEKRERDYEELAFRTYLHAVSLEVKEKGFEEETITKEDIEQILKLASLPDIDERIVNSIAPSIHGLRHVKLALALQLFGGVPKTLPDGIKIRGDINILLVGDPGTAKTQLLKYMAQIAPKGIYTSGKGVSAAGLTAAVVRDKTTGDFYLEAGALVLADQGIALVDEIDKMRAEDRVAMHEVMEQQTVSIAKAGIVATLNARCAILAAANPHLGRFDKTKTISENIDLPITLLSRFDLIFPIIDVPSREEDAKLAEHILNLHSQAEVKYDEKMIGQELLRKYVAYARRNVKPVLSKQAMKEIMDFYLKMRELSYKGEGTVAITPRQLEALVRLTEAKARMSLRNECTSEDAITAISLMRAMMEQSLIDVKTQKVDVDIVMTGIPKSQRDKHAKLVEILSRLGYEKESVDKEEVLNLAENEGIPRYEAEKILKTLASEGHIYEPKPGFIKRTP
jgi:Predicted ATPase involved in replication control, Cdc46/Mcm family